MKRPSPHMRRTVPAAIIGISLVASLTGTTAAGAATTPSGGSPPVASGSVAALSGSSMEVQNQQSGQVTVNWTPSTTFSQTATVPSTSVAAGDCVSISGSSSKSTITAKTVTISQPTAGKCSTGGFGGGAGRFGGGQTPPGGGSGQRPGGGSGRPPGGGRFGGTGNVGFASGKVTAVGSNSLTISGFSSASISKNAKKSTKSSKKPSTSKTTTVKVTTNSTTTYAEDQTAAAANLAVGDCVTAAGSSDSTGAVSATNVRITSTGGQTCTTGFGRGATGG
jgi:hypothetical protein